MFEIVEQTFYSWVKKYRCRSEEPGGFTQVEVVPTLEKDKPRLFAEVGVIKLYQEVTPEYANMLSSFTQASVVNTFGLEKMSEP